MVNLYILNMFKSKLRRLLLEEMIEKLRKANANDFLAIYQFYAYYLFELLIKDLHQPITIVLTGCRT